MFSRLLVAFASAGALFTAAGGTARASSIAAAVPAFVQVAKDLGPAPPTQKIHLVLHLPYPNPTLLANFVSAVNDPSSPSYGQYLTPTRFTAMFGPSQHGYSQVEYVAGNYGFQIVTSPNRKTLDLVGTVAQADLMFGNIIHQYSYNNIIYYANAGPAAFIDETLAGLVGTVTGLNNFVHKVAQPPLVKLQLAPPFAPSQIQTAYDEPLHQNPAHTARGTTLAIETVYDYNPSDLNLFLNTYHIALTGSLSRKLISDPLPFGLPIPQENQETTLDVEQAAASDIAGNIVVYEASDPLDATFDDLYQATVNDPTLDVVTTSWGSCEVGNDPAELQAENDLFEQAAAEGQTRFAASGDYGAHDCAQNSPPYGLPGQPNPANVDFPASSPYVTGVGGTTLLVNSRSGYGSELAWSGSGGGASGLFSVPSYQAGLATLADPLHRNVPDTALSADPNRPYAFAYGGSFVESVGGTSAAAPNMAALYAQIDQNSKRRIGMAQPSLYAALRANTFPGIWFHDVTLGNNGAFASGLGYDDVTGVGSVNGYWLMRSIPSSAHPMPL